MLYLLQKISKILNLNVILDQKLNFMCHYTMIISLSKTWSAEFLTSPLQKALLFRNLPFCSDASSVASGEAGGRGYSPHWPEEYAKHPVFGTFETDFCTKNENSPPQWYWR